jgi:hypothetical protein
MARRKTRTKRAKKKVSATRKKSVKRSSKKVSRAPRKKKRKHSKSYITKPELAKKYKSAKGSLSRLRKECNKLKKLKPLPAALGDLAAAINKISDEVNFRTDKFREIADGSVV